MAGRISNVEVNYVRRPDPSAALRMTTGGDNNIKPAKVDASEVEMQNCGFLPLLSQG